MNKLKKRIEKSRMITLVVVVSSIFAFIVTSIINFDQISSILNRKKEFARISFYQNPLPQRLSEKKIDSDIILGEFLDGSLLFSNTGESIYISRDSLNQTKFPTFNTEILFENKSSKSKCFLNLELYFHTSNTHYVGSEFYFVLNKYSERNPIVCVPAYESKSVKICFLIAPDSEFESYVNNMEFRKLFVKCIDMENNNYKTQNISHVSTKARMNRNVEQKTKR